ncbi:hypothetical protein [Legionella sainthelensi]|uniref:hypothetical protein n=1 Tax=Legionella sainthelensi TaxID=28087 RepID=UPI001C2B8C4A|nr:hypothetical protein [Legionella sainthelensi]
MNYASSLVLNIITGLVKLCRPGGVRSVIAENVALRQQLLILKRSHRRAPKLKPYERTLLGTLVALISNKRLPRTAIIIKPSTILNFHKALVKRKYSLLFSRKTKNRPGPKGPSKEIINAIVTMKQKNPRFGYLRIAMQLSNAFGIDIDKDRVRRVLAKSYKPNNSNGGPSWLSMIANTKDSLWSMDFFRVESITLSSYWVMIMMDQFSRKIVGFATNRGDISGQDLCFMFNSIRTGYKSLQE